MKNLQALAFCFILFSCSPESELPPVESPDDKSAKQPVSYEPFNAPFEKPQVEVMKVSQSEITINWFNPSNWQSLPSSATQPEFLIEASTNPKFDNLVTTRQISDSFQSTFSNLQPDTLHHFRVTALPPADDPRYLRGESTILMVMTASYPNEQVGGFIVNPELGKVHFSWNELEQPGPIDYVVHLFDDDQSGKPFREFITRENEIRDVILQGGRTYWAKFRAAPAEDNNAFKTTAEITVEFEVTGNPLPKPVNITAIDRNGTLVIQWSPTTTNVGKFSYMMNVKTGETLEQPFGNFTPNESIFRIPNAKPYGRFSFEINCFPQRGNFIDLESPFSTHTFDYPKVYCPTPINMPVTRLPKEVSSIKISLKEPPEAPMGHRYEIEVASDPEFSSGIDRRRIEGIELETVMTGRVPEETHYVRIRMIGPEDDATVIASSWTDTIIIGAKTPLQPVENPLP